MFKEILQKTLSVFLCLGLISGIVFYLPAQILPGKILVGKAETINTSVTITACGNSIVETGEQCDDGNNISGDGCSSTCQNEVSGGGGTSPTPYEEMLYYTRAILEGKAYPNASVSILKDGQFLTNVRADSQASFKIEISDIAAGTYTFGLWAQDKNGIKSLTFSFTVNVVSGVTTTVSGILLPPTTNLSKNVLLKEEGLQISGQTIPDGRITIFIYRTEPFLKEIFQDVVLADFQGNWYYLFDTKNLEYGIYEIKAKSTSREGLLSIFSRVLTFEIESILPPKPPVPPVLGGGDLNKDGRVNLIDFSIMLYWWGKSNEYVDQNRDGVVDLIDCSIMLYWWTG